MNTAKLTSSLRTAVSSMHKLLRKQVSEAGAFSMTELETIGLISRHKALLPTELAARTKITTQSMSQILKKMEVLGFIKRTPSKEDKRKVFVSLSVKGRNFIDKLVDDRDEYLRKLIENHLSDKEKQLLIKALPVLIKLSEINQGMRFQ